MLLVLIRLADVNVIANCLIRLANVNVIANCLIRLIDVNVIETDVNVIEA
jgi:hypothetical protein